MTATRATRRNVLRRISTRYGRVAAHDHDGHGAPIVLLHGFPDDSRIHDRIVPLLYRHRVVTIDFVGYGASERTQSSLVRPGQRVDEAVAVLEALDVSDAVIVGHDSGGPVAVETALASERVSSLFLLNSYYGRESALRLPEMIQMFGDPRLAPLSDAVIADPAQRAWLLGHTARRFGYDPDAPDSVRSRAVIPQFFGDASQPDALRAVRAWTRALPRDLGEQTRRAAAGELRELSKPVTLAFGAEDRYLSPALARQMADRYTGAVVHEVPGASHWPQWDQPEVVAGLIADRR